MHILLAAVLASASIAVAQTPMPWAGVDEFWWSVPSVPTEDLNYYYIASVAPCGNGSCANCAPEAKPCSGKQWSNICYEPTEGERCCEDDYGTSCSAGFYCAYLADDTAAFCCKDGVSRDECTSVLSTDLYPGATTVIQYLTPTEVAQGQAKHSGDSDAKNKEDGLSLGAKIGIAIGAVAIVVLITGAIAFFILRKRRAAKLSAAQRSGDFSKPTPGHYEPPTGVATSQYDPGSPAPPAYASPVAQYGQPGMPNERSEYYKAPIAGAGTPYQNNAETYRQDGGQVAEMPVPEPQVYEMGASEPEKKS